MPTALRVAAAHATDLLFELALDDLLLLFRFLLVGSEHQFGVGRQRLQKNVEPFAVFVGKRHAQVQPVIILSLALDDGVGAMRRSRQMPRASSSIASRTRPLTPLP